MQYVTIGRSHPYQINESILISKGIRSIFLFHFSSPSINLLGVGLKSV